jgi:LysM repeat protein
VGIGDLKELFDCLKASVQGKEPEQFLSFGIGLFPEAGGLVGYLAPETTSITIHQRDAKTPLVQLDEPDSKVLVVGQAVLFAGSQGKYSYDVTIEGTVPQPSQVCLLLTGSNPGSDWNFAGNFPTFPPYLGCDDVTVKPIVPSFYDGLVVNHPEFRIANNARPDVPLGLSLTATLDLTTGSLKSLGQYFSDAKSIPFHGSIVTRKTFPQLDNLRGELKDYAVERLLEDLFLSFGVDDQPIPDFPDLPAGQSTLLLVGTSKIAGFSSAINMTCPVLQGDSAWVVTGQPAKPQNFSLASGLSALVNYAGGKQQLSLPVGLDAFSSMYLAGVTVSLAPQLPPAVQMIGFRVAMPSDVPWSAPILGLALTDLSIEWMVLRPFDEDVSLLGTISGILRFGASADAPRLVVAVDLSGSVLDFSPQVSLQAYLDPQYPIRIADLFRQFTGLELDLDLAVTDLRLEANTGTRELQFSANLQSDWKPVPLVEFNQLGFMFRYAPNGFVGSLSAGLKLAGVEFGVAASYRGANAGWLFTGGLGASSQGTTLDRFIENLTGRPCQLPANLGAIALQQLSVSLDTKSKAFTFHGALSWPFKFETFDLTLEAELQLEKRPDKPASGFVCGALMIDRFGVSVIYNFGVKENKSLAFTIRYKEIVFTCICQRNAKNQTILRANLGGVSFGDILEYLVNLVDPNLGFKLASPWDVLYQLRFDNLWLEANLTTKQVGVTYDIKLNLGFVNLEKIGLTYVNKAGRSTVDIAIVGEFLDTKYSDDDPLTWDLLNDPPPAPPGTAEQLLVLRYLGLGQNVTFRETKSFKSVRSVIEALQADFAETPDDKNPLTVLPNLKFGSDGNWLIGADFTLMSAISIACVFNDPVLYGLRVGLAGPRVKSLAGLEFEILYKKITDSIGLYHIELTLPDSMRQLMLGPVAVTMPIVAIDIYTNGNFRIDCGFPANRDFSRSFCVQGGPFIGYGGFYFALLNGATSEQVPQLRNGNFSPVIEFGLGLSVGVGRTIDKGVLKAGLTLTLEAILEGVLAWFNPNDRSIPSDIYFKIQGTAAIVGKLYGSVDFVVIKASVSVTAYASVTLIAEAFAPIQLQLEIGVEVEASLKILFITLTFSFEAKLDCSFSIGSGGGAPWEIVEPAPHRLQLRAQRPHHCLRTRQPIDVFRMLRDLAGETPTFDFSPRRVLNGPQDVNVLMIPSITTAIPSTVTASLREPLRSTDGLPSLQMVMALFVPTSTDSDAMSARDVRRVTMQDAASVPFNQLVAGVFRWTLSSLQKAPHGVVFRSTNRNDVTIGHLDAISSFLGDRKNRDATFTYGRVSAMLEQNFVLRISNPIGPTGGFFDAGSDIRRDAAAPDLQAAILPMIPEVAMSPQGAPTVEFWRHACADQAYREALEAYYDQLALDPEANVPKDPFAKAPRPPGPTGLAAGSPGRGLPPGCGDKKEPLSAMVFSDYFAMLAQQSVQAAIDLFNAYPYQASGDETLQHIADAFGGVALEYRTRPGDSLASMAGTFGVPVFELRLKNQWLNSVAHGEFLPAGSFVQLDVGPSVGKIAAANADYPLHYDPARPVRLTIEHVLLQVKSRQTLGGIAQAFGVDITDLLALPETQVNAENMRLLRGGSALTVPHFQYQIASDDMVVASDQAFDRIAAMFYTRSGQRRLDQVHDSWVSWYVATISARNPNITTGSTIQIPVARLDEQGQMVDTGKTTPYIVKASDTLARMAAAFELVQLANADSGFAQFRRAITPQPPITVGTTITIPGFAYSVATGDTLAAIADTFYLSIGRQDALAKLSAANRDADILQPLSVLCLPRLHYPIGENETLASVAAKLNLTIPDLADSVRNDPGLFTPYREGVTPPMIVPNVAARDIETLIADLVGFGAFNALAATVSRFLLSGMRVAQPGANADQIEPRFGLYDVVGQQFPAPVGGTGPYTIDFAKGSTAAWFSFEPPVGQRRANSASPHGDTMKVVLPDGFVAKNAPSTLLDPQIVQGPQALRLYDDVPVRHPIGQCIHWQASTDISLPGPSGMTGASGPTGAVVGGAGEPALWMFPQSLLAAAAGPTGPTASTRPYELLAIQPAQGGGSTEKKLSRYSWATAIPLRITRAHSDHGEFVPNAYQLVGADQDGRDLLLKAWSYLENADGNSAKIYLLYAPSAQSENPGGLSSDAILEGKTFLLKTNLSTETHSNATADRVARPVAISGDYYSTIKSPAEFLKHVWEASVTGSGGFYLNYVTTSSTGLPDDLFADGDEAKLWAVVLLDSQSRSFAPDRRLYPFNNCAVLAENLDAAALGIFAQLQEPLLPRDSRRVASIPPGTIGFTLTRRNPSGASGPMGLTQQLYNLVGYQIAGTGGFDQSNEGLPVSPVTNPPGGATGATGLWHYQQIIPISHFGVVNDCPQSTVLPAAEENPYRGIAVPFGATGPLAAATINLTFHDVYGNQTLATEPLSPVTAPVGYTDDVIGIAAWPGGGFDYLFSSNATGIGLDATLSLQTDRYLPSRNNPFETAMRTANADAERYRQIFYQVQQHDLQFALQSNIGTPQFDPADLKAALAGFVTKATVFSTTVLKLAQVQAPIVASATLGEEAKRLAVTVESLSVANQNLTASDLFADLYLKPVVEAAAPMNTLADLASRAVGHKGFVDGIDADSEPALSAPLGLRMASPGESARSSRALPRAIAGTDPATIAKNNQTQPLGPAITLRTRPRPAQALKPLFDRGIDNTLAAVASALQCNVYTEVRDPAQPQGALLPVGLLWQNWTVAQLVAPNIAVTINGTTVTTNDSSTFDSIYQSFAKPLTRSDYAAAIQNLLGILRADKKVEVADFITPQPSPRPGDQPGPTMPWFSLCDLAKQIDIADVPDLNRLVPNFFFAGSPILLGTSACKPGKGDTLATLAQQAKITLEQFARFNATTGVKPGVNLVVPNLTSLASTRDCWCPFAPKSTDSFQTVAASVGSTPLELASINRDLPGIFALGAAVQVNNTSFSTTSRDSLQSVFQRAVQAFPQLQWDQFVGQLQSQAVYRSNGVLVTPLASVGGSNGVSSTIDAIASTFNLDAATMLRSNAALRSFLRENATLAAPSDPEHPNPSIKVGPFDTVETIIRRFKDDQGLTVTVAGLALANQGVCGLLTVGSSLLIPPAPTLVTMPFTPQVPPLGASGESQVIFPVEVSLVMTRSSALVSPDFIGVQSVQSAVCTLSPRAAATSTAALTAFAEAFELAFHEFRLKCAVATQREVEQTRRTGQVWAVNFGPTGVSRFAVNASLPKFYALRPLATKTFNGDLRFPVYESGKGLCGRALKRFQAVDLDAWMRQFLQTVDLFLTPPYAVAAFQLGATGPIAPAPRSAPTSTSPQGPVGFANFARIQAMSVLGTFGAMGATGCTGATAPAGPADYERIVDAKKQIAAALRQRVWPIVQAPGATGTYEWENARETLYQQMLVTLADAHNVNAIVQFPVAIDSPLVTPAGFTGSNPPPRAAGKLIPSCYALQGAPGCNTLTAVAAHYGVSAPYLAQILGNSQGLLLPGVKVIDYEVQTTDTLNKIAAHFAVPTDPTQPGYWEDWAPFITSIETIALFQARASFPLSLARRVVFDGETVDVLGEFFGRDAISVARGNERLPGILLPGSFILDPQAYPKPYCIQAGDDLRQIAVGVSHANPSKPRVTLDLLAGKVGSRTGVLRAGITLSMAELIPDLSISTSKVSLGRVGSTIGSAPPLSFLLTLKQQSEHDKLLLNLEYKINEIEHAISSVPDAGNYQASSWLTLVLPIGPDFVQTGIEQVQIPIPLRAYPSPPLLSAQAGGAAPFPAQGSISDARKWNYSFDVENRHAAQDTNHIEVRFGESLADLVSAKNLGEGVDATLATALAAFVEASPLLSNDLAILPTLRAGTQDQTAACAVAAFSYLAEDIAHALSRKARVLAASAPADTYAYRMGSTSDGEHLRTLTLDVEQGPTGASAIWPELAVSATGSFKPMSGTGGRYEYPPDIPANRQLAYRFLFKERDVIRNSTGRGAISITRNDRLIAQGPLGPTGSPDPVPTCDEFVYRTSQMQFADPLIPLIDNDVAFDVAKLTSSGHQPLNRYIEALLGAAIDVTSAYSAQGHTIEILCSYGFSLASGLVATTPIQLVPAVFVAGASEFSNWLAKGIGDWRRTAGVARDQGMMVFQLSVFAQAPAQTLARPHTAQGAPICLAARGSDVAAGATGALLKPILRLRNLQLAMSEIDWEHTGPVGLNFVQTTGKD